MKNKKIILIISICFALLVNIPRISNYFGGRNSALFEVSLMDILLRVFFLFGFCFMILKLNITWFEKWFKKNKQTKAYVLSLIIFIVWLRIFKSIYLLAVGEALFNPRLIHFVYVFMLIILLIISRTILLSNQSKKDAVEKERLKKRNVEYELSNLKNQLNPHFLFNSLNTLTLLVRNDPDSAEKFIAKLSILYRSMLQSNDEDLVLLGQEIDFLESYIYLLKQRFRENFNVEIKIENKLLELKIPSLALQLLVENTLKHNEISKRNPLTVYIYNKGNTLFVKNKIQKRRGDIDSTKTGLANLNERFKLLLGRSIEVVDNQDQFTIKLPL